VQIVVGVSVKPDIIVVGSIFKERTTMIEIISRKLAIFERFDTDNTLPKHLKKAIPKEGHKYVLTPDYIEQDFDEQTKQGGVGQVSGTIEYLSWSPKTEAPITESHSRWKRFFKRKPKQPKLLSPAETYTIVFHNTEQLKEFTAKQDAVEKIIQNAKENGQIALVEDLTNKHQINVYEDALVILGYTRFITESMLVDLAERSEKAFCLDWIRNFARIIPDHVAERKKQLDQSLIFDNYAVLHYDPDGRGNKLTQTEIRAKRDPVLFGLIKNSRRLYLIADWIDTTCDLTFEELLKHFEQNKVSATPTKTTLT